MKGQGFDKRRVAQRPGLDGLKNSLSRQRGSARPVADGFMRESFVLPREHARAKAREWFDRWPKQAYWTAVESWAERSDDTIEFTLRRLPAAD